MTLQPIFRVLCELPQPIQSDAVESLQREYPSAAFLDAETLFVADGYGSLYAISAADAGPASLFKPIAVATPMVRGSSELTLPFRIHRVASPSDGYAAVVLSAKHYPENSPPATKHSKPPPVKFDVWGVQVAFPLRLEETQTAPILWHRRGADVPLYTAYDASRSSFLLVGNTPYLPVSVDPTPTYEPSLDELAPVPRPSESLDAPTSAATPSMPKPPPYSWTQTSDSLTIAIPLPADTPTARIRVGFAPGTLTVRIDGAPPGTPRYVLRPLWGAVRADACVWTFDRAAERRFGVLALHLDKRHEGTRWPQGFASPRADGQGGKGGEEWEEEEVPETLDPTELYAIREALEKYTADLEQSGLGGAVPSLAEGERDDEVDLDVGDMACATLVRAADGAAPPGTAEGAPLQVLSTPFPGDPAISLVAKHGLEGAAFVLDPAAAAAGAEGACEWTHGWTFSALAFVLASKRDTRFVHHAGPRAVFAFESGGGAAGGTGTGGNVYVYYGAGPRENHARQTVLKIGGGAAGALLGVGAMSVLGGQKTIVLCLCEGELVVLHGVL